MSAGFKTTTRSSYYLLFVLCPSQRKSVKLRIDRSDLKVN